MKTEYEISVILENMRKVVKNHEPKGTIAMTLWEINGHEVMVKRPTGGKNVRCYVDNVRFPRKQIPILLSNEEKEEHKNVSVERRKKKQATNEYLLHHPERRMSAGNGLENDKSRREKTS